MLYLVTNIFLVFFAYYFDFKGKTRYKYLCYGLVYLAFILIAGLRYRIGIDSVTMSYNHDHTPTLSQLADFDYDSTRYGRGYLFFNAIARSISPQFYVLQFVHAIFLYTTLFWFFNKYSKNIFTCLVFFYTLAYFNYSFEIIRESCAVCCFLIGWRFFVDKKWVKYYLFVVLAILFHPSASLLLLLPIFRLKPIRDLFICSWRTPIYIIIVFVIGKIIANKFFDYIQLIEIADVQSYAESYSDSHYGEGRENNLLGYVTYLFNIFYPFIAFIIYKNQLLKGKNTGYGILDQKYSLPLQMAMCLYFYFLISILNIAILYRFTNYFIPFIILLLANTLQRNIYISRYKVNFIFLTWFVVMMPYFMIHIGTRYYTIFVKKPQESKMWRYYPYKSIITNEKDQRRENQYFNEGAPD